MTPTLQYGTLFAVVFLVTYGLLKRFVRREGED